MYWKTVKFLKIILSKSQILIQVFQNDFKSEKLTSEQYMTSMVLAPLL